MSRTGRTLIVAFDGTSNEFDETNTNVVKLCSVLKMNDRDRQMVYYQPGIGTYTDPSIRGKLSKWFLKTTDLAAAWTLGDHVCKGYEFLMDNYLPHDRICIFGFSRGAYTARALCGMLDAVGLLSRGNQEQVPFAYRMYKSESRLAPSFKNTFCSDVDIHFVGVWDTVASMGMFVPRRMPLASYKTIKTFRHAISLDETRARFGVKLWKPSKEVTGPSEQAASKKRPTPRVKEMWFPGGHCDVGGGNVLEGAPAALSNISFRWMLHEMQQADCGILFDDKGLDMTGVPADCVARTPRPGHRARTSSDDTVAGTEYTPEEIKARDSIPSWEYLDTEDAKADRHIELKPWSFWWLVQWPVLQGKKDTRLFWGTRSFPEDHPRKSCAHIHPCVLTHMEFQKAYTPTAKLPENWREHVAKDVGGSKAIVEDINA